MKKRLVFPGTEMAQSWKVVRSLCDEWQYSWAHSIIFTTTAWPGPVEAAWYPNPSLAWNCRPVPMFHKHTMTPVIWLQHLHSNNTYYTDYAQIMPLGLLPHCVELATCVRVFKELPVVELNPYPPSGTLLAWPLNPYRVFQISFNSLSTHNLSFQTCFSLLSSN